MCFLFNKPAIQYKPRSAKAANIFGFESNHVYVYLYVYVFMSIFTHSVLSSV